MENKRLINQKRINTLINKRVMEGKKGFIKLSRNRMNNLMQEIN